MDSLGIQRAHMEGWKKMKYCSLLCTLFFLSSCLLLQSDESIQSFIPNPGLTIQGIHYRQAKWETEKLQEESYAWPNHGGYIFVYFTNSTDATQSIRNWYMNREEGSRMRLGHKVAWDRLYHDHVSPGQTSVLEICGLSEDFQPEKPFEFAFVGGNWRPSGGIRTVLQEEPVQITFIHIKPGLRHIEVFIRNTGKSAVTCNSIQCVGKDMTDVQWATQVIPASANTISRIELDAPLFPGELLIVKLTIEEEQGERIVYAHRRAHADFFPIGTWGANTEHFQYIRQHHVDTIVKGGRSDDEFFSQHAEKYGFRSLVHTGVYPNIDVLRDLGDHPAVAAWMVQDEPDWNCTPQQIFTSVEMTHHYNSTKPTMITLCRNGKFFEYAFLPDIACQDHYSVTAPTSSIWPFRYGTRLEETAYYTRDLKRAAEPKPIWIWSQGLANWDERPKRPVPTPDELAAQLLFNLGRGAKGLLWFTFDVQMGEKYPEMHQAMQDWGRVMQMIRTDLLAAEPVNYLIQSPEKLDVTMLASWDKVFIFVINLDYKIHDEAYPWTPVENSLLTVQLPDWMKPASVIKVSPAGVMPIPFQTADGLIKITPGVIRVGKLFILDNSRLLVDYEKDFEKIRLLESKIF